MQRASPWGTGRSACRRAWTWREGKYHQVKRMLASRGKPVVYLKRLGMGKLKLDPTLPAGAWRPLTPEELADLGR